MARLMRHARSRGAKIPHYLRNQHFGDVLRCKGCDRPMARQEANSFSPASGIEWRLCDNCLGDAINRLPSIDGKVLERTKLAVAKLREDRVRRSGK